SQKQYKDLQDCFMATTSADLHYRGRKIIGSAQLRRKSAVLQHGSLLINQDQNLMSQLLNLAAPGNPHANLAEVLGRTPSFAELDAALQQGFEKAFPTKCGPAPL